MDIWFQPKQNRLYQEVLYGKATNIGFYGGRGCGKSLCLDFIIISLMMEAKAKNQSISICCVMRNFDQVFKYHFREIQKNFPELKPNMTQTPSMALKIGKGICVFDFGNSEENIERRFRSGNYDIILVDQAELFEEEEILELKKTIRSTSGFKSKLVLSFNMRGYGIQWLKKWFNNDDPHRKNAEDYVSIKINPWDNSFYVIDKLIEDGYTFKDYFRWTNDQRKEYSSLYGDYTKSLSNLTNDAVRMADWEGTWDSVEGSFFSNVFDLETTRIKSSQVFELKKDWATLFIGQDWGRTHYTVTYWNFRVTLSPSEANRILGWNLQKSINVLVTYKELILNNLESNEIAQEIVNATPKIDRGKIKSFYLGQDAFKTVDSKNTIEMKQSEILRANGMPGATKANWVRVQGWAFMAQLLKATKGKGYYRDSNNNLVQSNDVWLISNECPQLLEAIPKLMRDKDNIEDVEKTDKSKTDINQDSADAARYCIASMLAARAMSEEDKYIQRFNEASPEEQMLMAFKKVKEAEMKKSDYKPPSWRDAWKR